MSAKRSMSLALGGALLFPAASLAGTAAASDGLTLTPAAPQQAAPQQVPQQQAPQQPVAPAPHVVPGEDPVQVPRVIELPQDNVGARRTPRAKPEEDDLDVPDFLK